MQLWSAETELEEALHLLSTEQQRTLYYLCFRIHSLFSNPLTNNSDRAKGYISGWFLINEAAKPVAWALKYQQVRCQGRGRNTYRVAPSGDAILLGAYLGRKVAGLSNIQFISLLIFG